MQLSINLFDILIAILLLIGLVYGGFRGAVRQITGILSSWLALIISLWLYPIFSSHILQGLFTEASPTIMDSFAFVILIIIFAFFIQLIFIFTSQSPEERLDRSGRDIEVKMETVDDASFAKPLNTIGGIFIGFFSSLIWLSVIMTVVRYALTVAPPGGSLARIASYIDVAMITPYFYQIIRLMHQSVILFTPGNLPAVFSFIL